MSCVSTENKKNDVKLYVKNLQEILHYYPYTNN